MITARTLLLIVIFSWLAQGQTTVDKVASQLDSLSAVSFDDWKVSPDLKILRPGQGDPTTEGFDDSAWESLKINQRIYPDSCWLRKTIVLPAAILGKPVQGALRFRVSVDDYGYLWVNGQSKGHFPWSGEFDLTNDAKPGEKFLIAIKAINTGGPLRLIRADVQTASSREAQEKLADLSLSLRVGQKLLSFDTYQTNSTAKADPGADNSRMEKNEKLRLAALLQSLAGQIDIDALKTGAIEKFEASLASVRAQLKPVQEFARRFTLYFDSNAHIDAAWLWRERETIEVCKNTFSSVFNIMNQRPDFTYTQSSAAYYDWMERLYPDVFKKIQQRVKDGRWEVVGGMWVEPDCNIPGGESWAHHLLYGKRYFRQRLGADVKIGWNPDSFGYSLNMPMFYSNAGIDAFITQKIGWNETNVFPYRVFWWTSPDGSTMLSYFPFDYVNTIEDPFSLVDWMRQFEANCGFTKLLILFGVGDHGGGPSLEMLSRIDRLKTLDIFPAIEYGTAAGYLTWLRGQDLSHLPRWTDELYLEYHQGTFTTQAAMKKFNRSSETLLSNAEKFSSIAMLSGRHYHSTDIEEAWKKVLFNQFHDILPGSGIREVYIDATESHTEAQTIAAVELKSSLAHITRQINTSFCKHGKPIVVWNPLTWERTDVVKVRLPEGDHSDYAVFNEQGTEIASQAATTGKYDRDILFTAEGIPSLGYALYELRKQKPGRLGSSLHISNASVENGLFKVTLDPSTGMLKSIVDKRVNKELLSGKGNELQLLEDTPSAYDAWNIGLTGKQYPISFRQIEIVETGPVRAVVRVHFDYLKPGTKKDFPTEYFPSSFFTQDIVLFDVLDRIDFVTDVDWWEDKTMLKVAFPLTVSDTVATYEIPYGSITRSTQMRTSWEKAKVEVPAVRWADLSSDAYGVSLLNNSKYGYDIKGSTIRLSLLRSPKWPDPTADRGKHSIEYSLYPHSGRLLPAKTVRRGHEINNPLFAVLGDLHKGVLGSRHSFVSVAPENIVLTSIKKAEDADAWIIQWYNADRRNTVAKLLLPAVPKKVLKSDFLESDGEGLPFKENAVSVKTRASGMVTLKVVF